MKNTITYYYDIIIDEYKKRDNKFIFYSEKIKYEFVEYYGDIKKLIELYSLLKYNKRLVDEIIPNKNNEIITYFENKPYILLKKCIYDNNNNKLTLKQICEYNFLVYSKEQIKWKKLWKEKIDYYEIYLDEIKLKYPLLKNSFYYYFGLSEVAINLLNYVDYRNIDNYICHKRIECMDDMFNPLNILIDSRIRDIAEFIKTNYMYGNISVDNVIEFLDNNYLSKDESILLLARLIYPSYYFDIYEKICFESQNEDMIEKIINKNIQYESFIKQIYKKLKIKNSIMQIEFLEH